MLYVKRIYEVPKAKDGTRYLVERLWPRGMKKVNLKMDAWLREAAPSRTAALVRARLAEVG
jgi:uncharacterized protein YeaO (DUF488 family)